jgi:hypothetical protein
MLLTSKRSSALSSEASSAGRVICGVPPLSWFEFFAVHEPVPPKNLPQSFAWKPNPVNIATKRQISSNVPIRPSRAPYSWKPDTPPKIFFYTIALGS